MIVDTMIRERPIMTAPRLMGLSRTNVTSATLVPNAGRIVMLRQEARLLANGPA
jgi:hypothetical protein